MRWTNTKQFYKSKEWERLRKICIDNWTKEDGFVYCSACGKPIVKPYDLIVHHKTALTDSNVNDAGVSLNPDNLQPVHLKCHNAKHDRFTAMSNAQRVVIVYGPPLAGKTTYVRQMATTDDIIVDLDSIKEMISNADRYDRVGGAVRNFSFKILSYIYNLIKMRSGNWKTAYIIATCPRILDRRMLKQRVNADELLFIYADEYSCMERSGERPDEWKEYIRNWFKTYEEGE